MTHLLLMLSIVSFADDTERDKAVAAIKAAGAKVTVSSSGSVDVYVPKLNSDRQMALLKDIPNLNFLTIDSQHVSLKTWQHILHLEKLRILQLLNFSPTQKNVKLLNQFSKKQLVRVYGRSQSCYLLIRIHNTSDNDFKLVGKLKYLTSLTVRDSPKVTDVGLEYLRNLKHLTGLTLYKTNVTDEGLETLQKQLPNLKRVTNKNPVMQ